jgi:hypothetical protein
MGRGQGLKHLAVWVRIPAGYQHHSVTRLALCLGMASRVGEFEEPQEPNACTGLGNRSDQWKMMQLGRPATGLENQVL